MADDDVRALRERVPPHNNEAEQSVLGAMFLSVDAVESCLALISPEDFYRPQHQRIFAAIRDLHHRGEAVDQITVAARLESNGDLEAVGGKAYLLDLAGAVPSAANAEHYARIVKRTSLLRQLIGAATAIQVMSYENPDDIDEVVERAEKAVFDVTNKRVTSRFQPLGELMKTGFEEIEHLYDHKSHITGVPTGFPDLDKILAGMHRGDLIILAARPSVGKTALALNIAVNAAKAGARPRSSASRCPLHSWSRGSCVPRRGWTHKSSARVILPMRTGPPSCRRWGVLDRFRCGWTTHRPSRSSKCEPRPVVC